MERKVELRILNIANSQAQVGAFAMLLGELNGERQLPIIIGPAEAQVIALTLKGIQTPRPLTHELFITCLRALGATLSHVLIYKVQEGIFYSSIYLKKDEEIISLDSRTSDAVALAARANCPILIYDSILEQECLHISDIEKTTSEEEKEEEEKAKPSHNTTPMSIEEKLEQAIKEEDYERAAQLRDRIKSRNKN